MKRRRAEQLKRLRTGKRREPRAGSGAAPGSSAAKGTGAQGREHHRGSHGARGVTVPPAGVLSSGNRMSGKAGGPGRHSGDNDASSSPQRSRKQMAPRRERRGGSADGGRGLRPLAPCPLAPRLRSSPLSASRVPGRIWTLVSLTHDEETSSGPAGVAQAVAHGRGTRPHEPAGWGAPPPAHHTEAPPAVDAGGRTAARPLVPAAARGDAAKT